MDNMVILVDFNDRAIGEMEKLAAHQKGLLHRAFSVFAYDRNEILIHKRAKGKYHCGGLWTNTCCSHPRPGENVAAAAKRRLEEELNIKANNFAEEFRFFYRSQFANGITEFECDYVLTCRLANRTNITPDADEVEELLWIDREDLLNDMRLFPDKYTPWFLISAPRVIELLKKRERG